MTSNDVTNVMDQFAGNGVEPQTPLHHVQMNAVSTESHSGAAGVELSERELTGQLVLRIRGNLDSASEAVKGVVGLSLPDRLMFAGNPTDPSSCTLAWMSPDEWRLCCPADQAFTLEQQLRTALSSVNDTTHAIVNNSGGYTILELSGANALDLLKKSTGYDVRSDRFPVGKAVGTTFAKTSVTLLRTADDHWQIWARRSFSDYLWLWLQNAAREYGLRLS